MHTTFKYSYFTNTLYFYSTHIGPYSCIDLKNTYICCDYTVNTISITKDKKIVEILFSVFVEIKVNIVKKNGFDIKFV